MQFVHETNNRRIFYLGLLNARGAARAGFDAKSPSREVMLVRLEWDSNTGCKQIKMMKKLTPAQH